MSTGFKIIQDSTGFPNNVGFNGGSFSSGTVYYSMAGAFTLEAWVNLTGYPTSGNSFLSYNNTFNGLNFYIDSVGLVHFDIPGPGGIIQTTAPVRLNTWTHLALTRSSNNDCTIFINGVAAATGSTGSRLIGTNGGSDFCSGINGRVSNLRLVAGTNLYPTNFTPPVVPLSAVSGTVIILCKATTFIDSGPNNYSFTVSGSPVIYLDASYQVDVDDVLVRREYFNGGNVYGWGRRDSGEQGLSVVSPTTPNIVAGGYLNWKQISTGSYSSAGIKTDGTLWYWGGGTNTISQEPTSSAWVFLDTSSNQSNGGQCIAAIKSDNTLWVWGDNTNARLGTNNTSYYSSPTSITGGGLWKFVKFGSSWTMGIKTDGTLWGWGYNGEGMLGDGTSVNKSSPVQVSGGGTWKTVGAGTSHSSGIKTDGTIWSWGFNNMGQIGNGVVDAGRYLSPVSNAAVSTTTWRQVTCGYRAALAVGMDGTLWGCGYNNAGQLGQGGDWRNATLKEITGGGTTWKQVAFGGGFAMGLKTDGTVWAWGSNNVGQLGQGNTTNTTSPVQVTLPTTSIKALMSSDPGNATGMVVMDITT